MATTMEGSFTVPAEIGTVWTKLNDPVVLKRCIGGCDTFERTDDTHFMATAKIKFGPVSASIAARIALHDVQAPFGCRIVGEGGGRFAGFAKGAADVRLEAVSGGTRVDYAVEADVGGRLAKLGGRLIDGVAKKLADRFFVAFAASVSTGTPEARHAAEPQPPLVG